MLAGKVARRLHRQVIDEMGLGEQGASARVGNQFSQVAPSEPAKIVVRVGIPNKGGALLAAARHRGYPVLVSANAFAQYEKHGSRKGWFKGFSFPDPRLFGGMDVALDSAGYVAMSLYRGYPWSLKDYLDLAASFDWAWYAHPDFCCEQEIAGDLRSRRLRCAATVHSFYECAREASRRRMRSPMPVLQGQTPEDYLWTLDRLPIERGMLVGVGSMCRRNTHGPAGILAVLDALDRALPDGCKVHLFGVKSDALGFLRDHPRVVSTDSCAWDAGARRERSTGRTQAFRIEKMAAWKDAQESRLRGETVRRPMSGADSSQVAEVIPDDLEDWADLVASGECTYNDAMWHYDRCSDGTSAYYDDGVVSATGGVEP